MCFYQKDVSSQSEITVYINTIIEKNKQGEGGRFNDDKFFWNSPFSVSL